MILSLEEVERRHVLKVLAWMGGNRARTAKALDISVRGLHMKLGQVGDR